MNLEIDHLFQVVSSEEEAYALAKATGFKIFHKKQHTGQGTSAIFLMFEQNYFEYIWLSNEEEAQNNQIRFDLKRKAVQEGGSPFGIAMRGDLPIELVSQFIEYRPEYGIGKYQIRYYERGYHDQRLPKFFQMSSDVRKTRKDWLPKNILVNESSICNFEANLKLFNSVTVYGKELPDLKIGNVNFVVSNENKLVINEGCSGQLTPLVFY